MTISLLDNNSQLMNGTEQDLFTSKTILQHYTLKIFFDSMVANDKITIRVYDEDINDSTEKLYREIEIVGVQDVPVVLINWIPSSGYRVSCEQTEAINTISTILVSGGSGYVNGENLIIEGLTSGTKNAIATADSTGTLTGVTIVDGGFDYVNGESLTITGGSGIGATATISTVTNNLKTITWALYNV